MMIKTTAAIPPKHRAEMLRESILQALSDRVVTVSTHDVGERGGFMDVDVDSQRFAIEVFNKGGYGLSRISGAEGYGEKSDECLDDEEAVIRRLKALTDAV